MSPCVLPSRHSFRLYGAKELAGPMVSPVPWERQASPAPRHLVAVIPTVLVNPWAILDKPVGLGFFVSSRQFLTAHGSFGQT